MKHAFATARRALRLRGVRFALCPAAVALAGCNSAPPVPTTGFLSDYSRLEKADDRTLRLPEDEARLAGYSVFLIGPVEVRRAEGVEMDASDEDLLELAGFFAAALREEISRNYAIADTPGEGVARVRAAVTGARAGTPLLNVHPGTRLTGAGAGSVIAECEVVDSLSGEQLDAFAGSRQGPRVGFDGTTRLGDARAVLRGWAAQVRRRIDAAHGLRPGRDGP